MMKVIVVEETNMKHWKGLMNMFAASPFISHPWLKSFTNSYHKPIYFKFLLSDRPNTIVGIVGGLILEPRYRILKKINRSIFFFSGPALIQYNDDMIRSCLAALTVYASAAGFTRLDLRSWDYPYIYDLKSLNFFPSLREEFIINLRGTELEIKKKMKKTIREQTAKAKRNGVVLTESNDPAIIEQLVTLLNTTKSVRLSKQYEDYSYFYISFLDQTVLRYLMLNKAVRFFCAMKDNQPLCILMVVVYGKAAYALLIGTSETGYVLRAPAFTWLNTITTLKKEGVDQLNLGGVSHDSGASKLIYFKTSLGAEKHLCTGGSSKFLQGFGYKLIYQLWYNQASIPKKILSSFRRKIERTH